MWRNFTECLCLLLKNLDILSETLFRKLVPDFRQLPVTLELLWKQPVIRNLFRKPPVTCIFTRIFLHPVRVKNLGLSTQGGYCACEVSFCESCHNFDQRAACWAQHPSRVPAQRFMCTSQNLHCKKRLAIFPSPSGMSLTKLSLAGNNLVISRLGTGKLQSFFTVYPPTPFTQL